MKQHRQAPLAMLVVGYGNPLLGDDSLGWHAVAALERAAPLAAARAAGRLRLLACHQLTPELAEPLGRVVRALFVDARADDAPGHLRCEPLVPAGGGDAPALTHHLTPATLLALAHHLYGHAPRAWLLSLGGESFGYNEALSETVGAALPALLARALALLDE